jgi:2-keto-4-pentenoate hydratase/2-oxohepta-3-ene-1,7-dioic acid hydratase in catechol pathway
MPTRRELIQLAALTAAATLPSQAATTEIKKYVRFSDKSGRKAFGLLDGDTIHVLKSNYVFDQKPTRETIPLKNVTLLPPCDPLKVLAVGLNYKSHIGNRPTPPAPEMFYKPITCLTSQGADIVIPKDSKNTHYEGELVIIVGKTVRNATKEEAKAAIFGVTCGNDVSERDWQGGPQKDLQWWRAKGADTFGPIGPWVVTGLDYGNLLLQTKLNGEVVQKQNTSDLLYDCPAIVAYTSQYVTLTPGDVIYTGTPGSTKKMNPGDVVEVDIEGIGVLRNKVVAA